MVCSPANPIAIGPRMDFQLHVKVSISRPKTRMQEGSPAVPRTHNLDPLVLYAARVAARSLREQSVNLTALLLEQTATRAFGGSIGDYPKNRR